jgi:ATP-dependent Clp protease ATP-binding subunit ClpA
MFDSVWQSRWEDLLKKVPELRENDQRRELLDCLSDFPVWASLNETHLIEQLRSLPSESSREPVLESLAWMRRLETTKRSPETLRTIEALESDLRSRTARARKEPWKREAPYRGLNAFDRRHAPIFFGREAEVQRLIEVLATRREGPQFTAVVGASGSGKSSLVRAGLWARLEEGGVPNCPAASNG